MKREYGRVNADVAVGEDIGIELKREFTNGQKHRLSGQIVDYKKEFPCVLVVACGISDMDGWRELQNEHGSTVGFGMQQSEVRFIHKQSEHVGTERSNDGGGAGPFGGDSLF